MPIFDTWYCLYLVTEVSYPALRTSTLLFLLQEIILLPSDFRSRKIIFISLDFNRCWRETSLAFRCIDRVWHQISPCGGYCSFLLLKKLTGALHLSCLYWLLLSGYQCIFISEPYVLSFTVRQGTCPPFCVTTSVCVQSSVSATDNTSALSLLLSFSLSAPRLRPPQLI